MAQLTASDVSSWETAFAARSDLAEYGDNSLGLFALALRFGIEDLTTVAAESITDGNDDKKCDIIYIDRDNGIAVIAQCYKSARPKFSAPSNKASDLNTAAAWLLQRPIKDLPERIKSSAEELREALKAKQINEINFWYVHNLAESDNVKNEIDTVMHTAQSILSNHFPDCQAKIHGLEIGKKKFEEWYNDTLSPILVSDEFEIVISSGFEVEGPEWKAFVTTVPARFLRRTYRTHKTKIFSANIRDYLGSRSSDSNINNGIKKSAESDPDNFWVFNNGVTILVHEFEEKQKGKKRILAIRGMSIVNGAQTTGAIGSLTKYPADTTAVLARFVKTENTDLVRNIIQFNNSQNKVTASDFRSTDSIQKRIKEEMREFPCAEYEGGRRGGYGDAIKRRPNLLPSYTVGQALAAFHGDAVTAYNQKSEIWVNDRLYAKYFNDDTTAAHIICAYSLLRAVEALKLDLVSRAKAGGDITDIEKDVLDFFRKRGSIYLFVAAVSSCIEVFLGRKVPNLFSLEFKEKASPEQAQEIWSTVVMVVAPLCVHLSEAFADGLKNASSVQRAITRFKSLVAVTAGPNSAVYKEFATNF